MERDSWCAFWVSIEDLVNAALEEGLLTRRQRWRIMSYPLVIRLMIAMGR